MTATPAANRLFAAIDVGTNSVKMVIADLSADPPARVYEESVNSRLGEGMPAHSHNLREIPMRRTIDAIVQFARIAGEHQVQGIAAVGTAALRDSGNREVFIRRVKEQANVTVDAIPGEEEARLSYLAVRRDPHWRQFPGLIVIDVGGGSTEIVQGEKGTDNIAARRSVGLGAVRLTETHLKSDPPTITQLAAANSAAAEGFAAFTRTLEGLEDYHLVGVGGTLTNLGAMDRGGRLMPGELHGHVLMADRLEEQITQLAAQTVEQRTLIPGLDPRRADIILGGAILLSQALAHLGASAIDISTAVCGGAFSTIDLATDRDRNIPLSNIIAAIDIGTNSIRLAVVRADDAQHTTTLGMHREVVRLGEGEFEHNSMTPEAMARGALVCRKFAEVARGFGANEIVAFATSATREAENRDEFIDKVWQEAGIEVRVISGREEARLIWLGVTSGIDLGDRQAVLIDIGGGSTEVIVGTAEEYRLLESLRLGAIRVSNRYFKDDGPVSPEAFARVQKQVLGVAAPVARRVKALGFHLAMGSAGTITTLADIVARHVGDGPVSTVRNYAFKLIDLREVVQMLCRMPLSERLRVPGMDANRADIIVGGAAVLLTLMEACGMERMMLSERGLRDGILLDHLLREDSARHEFQAQSVRKRSILQLARSCNYEAEHAEHTAHLALRLFDELRTLGAHSYGAQERELLEYAALVHDIGLFISHSNHHKHAYYLIRNSDLLGFDDTEIDVMANAALYHRKGMPKKRHENLAYLDRAERHRILVLSVILRIAEGLDRSHLGLVRDIRLTLDKKPRRYVLTLLSDSDCQLEVWGVQNAHELFEYVFEAPVAIEVASAPQVISP